MSDPSTKSAKFQSVSVDLEKVDTLAGGTQAMRAAGTEMLPKHPDEELVNYQTRLQNSTLVNYYTKALDSAEGRAFQEPMTISGLPSNLTEYLEDIDGSGNSLDQLAREGFWNKLHHGATYLVVDYPKIEKQPRNLAEQKAIAARPYVYLILQTQVLAAYSRIEGGNERLTHFRWITSIVEPADDFLSESAVDVIRAYNQPSANDPVTLTEWRKTEKGWMILEDPTVIQGVSRIPVECDYGWRTGFFCGRPVLMDLADLNIAHYRSLSAQQHILSVARVPFLHAAGSSFNKPVPQPDGSSRVTEFKLTPHKATITDKDTTIQWVETEGKAIAAGAQNVEYLESKMEMMGLVPSTQRPGDSTATATAINAAEATAQLRAQAESYAQTLGKALGLFAEFSGTAAAVTVSLDASFKPAPEVNPNPNSEENTEESQAQQ